MTSTSDSLWRHVCQTTGLSGYRPGYEYDVHEFLMYILQQVDADAQTHPELQRIVSSVMNHSLLCSVLRTC